MRERLSENESSEPTYRFGQTIFPFKNGHITQEKLPISKDGFEEIYSSPFKLKDEDFEGTGTVEVQEDILDTAGEIQSQGIIYPVISHNFNVVIQRFLASKQSLQVTCLLTINREYFNSRGEVMEDKSLFFGLWQDSKSKHIKMPSLREFNDLQNLQLSFIRDL